MFAGIVPATVEWVIEEFGLQLYSAGITPAKGGPMLNMGANYPYRREGIEPLTEEESEAFREKLKRKFASHGYKTKVRIFEHNGRTDHNDFKIKVILKMPMDLDPEQYEKIRQAWKATHAASLLPAPPPPTIWGGRLAREL